MKKLLISLVLIIAVLGVLPNFLPVSVAQAIYATATDMEASVYGLEHKVERVGDIDMHFYANTQQDESRPALVLLHGYSADKDVWPRFAKHFLEDFHVIIPDMAGHGDTGFQSDWNYSGPAQAERIAQLMDTLNIQNAHIAGNSMGGFISAHFALMYPERTLSSILIDPAGVKSPQPSDMDLMLGEGKNPFEINNPEEFHEFFAMTMEKPPWFPGYLLDAVAANYQARKPELRAIFNDFHGKYMLDSKLKDITAPVLLLWGDKDRLIHVSSVDVWEAGIPNIQTKVWPGIGHMPMMEVPSESAQVIEGFIAQLN